LEGDGQLPMDVRVPIVAVQSATDGTFTLNLWVIERAAGRLYIFDKAIDVIPVYVAMQKKCFEDWLKSVGAEYEKQ